MDIFRKLLSKTESGFALHLAPYRRETNHAFPVVSIGYITRKRERITRVFNSYNFSFILDGAGTYLHAGKLCALQAPCVLTQSPGVPMDYGPAEWWEEFYLIYSADSVPGLKRRGLIDENRPLWRLPGTNVLLDLFRMMARLLEFADAPFVIDKIDVLCEMLVLESLSRPSPEHLSREQMIVHTVESRIRNNFLSYYDFDAIARVNGLHPATFRRYWNRYFPEAPAHYQMRLRMDEARRMLVESRKTVREIAYAAGFEDPLYFSRRFRREFGCTATEYRHHHQLTLGIGVSG